MTDDLKTVIGKAGGRLRALVAQLHTLLDHLYEGDDGTRPDREFMPRTLNEAQSVLNELDAVLSAPVVSLPSTVSIVRCEHGGVQIEGHTARGDWELELDACGDIIEIDKGSAPVVSPPQEQIIADAQQLRSEVFELDGCWLGHSMCLRIGDTINNLLELASAPRGGGETRPDREA